MRTIFILLFLGPALVFASMTAEEQRLAYYKSTFDPLKASMFQMHHQAQQFRTQADGFVESEDGKGLEGLSKQAILLKQDYQKKLEQAQPIHQESLGLYSRLSSPSATADYYYNYINDFMGHCNSYFSFVDMTQEYIDNSILNLRNRDKMLDMAKEMLGGASVSDFSDQIGVLNSMMNELQAAGLEEPGVPQGASFNPNIPYEIIVQLEKVGTGEPCDLRDYSLNNLQISFIPNEAWPSPPKVWLNGCLFNQVSNVDFTQTYLVGADFSEGNISDSNFSGVLAYNANFSETTIAGSQFEKSNLMKASFDSSQTTNSYFTSAQMKNLLAPNWNCQNCRFGQAKLDYGNFKQATLLGPYQSSSRRSTSNAYKHMDGATGKFANFSMANFGTMNTNPVWDMSSESTYKRCSLKGANFTSANFQGSDLSGCTMENMICDSCNFSAYQDPNGNGDLIPTNIHKTVWDQAYLRHADFSGVGALGHTYWAKPYVNMNNAKLCHAKMGPDNRIPVSNGQPQQCSSSMYADWSGNQVAYDSSVVDIPENAPYFIVSEMRQNVVTNADMNIVVEPTSQIDVAYRNGDYNPTTSNPSVGNFKNTAQSFASKQQKMILTNFCHQANLNPNAHKSMSTLLPLDNNEGICW